MFKLYGFAVSNYYNMVKLALLEKGLPFEEVTFYPAQTPESLAISPRGKVPVLGVDAGYINETAIILEYLEQSQRARRSCPAIRSSARRYWRLRRRSSCTSSCRGVPAMARRFSV